MSYNAVISRSVK